MITANLPTVTFNEGGTANYIISISEPGILHIFSSEPPFKPF